MKTKLWAAIVALFILAACWAEAAQGSAAVYNIPKFKITFHQLASFNILFEQDLTDAQIEKIIYEFRRMRINKDLPRYFPPVLPHLSDPYSAIQITIFTSPEWAAKKMIEAYINYRMPLDMHQKFADSIRGVYAWTMVYGESESGTIGDSLDNKIQSKNFRPLF